MGLLSPTHPRWHPLGCSQQPALPTAFLRPPLCPLLRCRLSRLPWRPRHLWHWCHRPLSSRSSRSATAPAVLASFRLLLRRSRVALCNLRFPTRTAVSNQSRTVPESMVLLVTSARLPPRPTVVRR